ncbi:MAG: hypothetical protein AAF717_09005 [Bacteroidota bacterium]
MKKLLFLIVLAMVFAFSIKDRAEMSLSQFYVEGMMSRNLELSATRINNLDCQECYDDVNYPEMREWAKAGVENGVGIPTNTVVFTTTSATNTSGLQIDIDNANAQYITSDTIQVVLITANTDITLATTLNMKDGVVLRGMDRQTSRLVVDGITYTSGNNQGSVYFGNGVEYAGLENLSIYYEPNHPCQPKDDLTQPSITQDFPTTRKNGGTDLATATTLENCNTNGGTPGVGSLIRTFGVKIDLEAHNNWLYQIDIDKMASHPIDLHGDNNEIREVFINRTFNKGTGGNGYITIRGRKNLIINNTFQRLRHITIDNRRNSGGDESVYNVLWGNTLFRVDVNFHDGVAEFVLVENNNIWPDFDVNHCQGDPFNKGSSDSGHTPTGDSNIAYKNDISQSGNPSQWDFNTVYVTNTSISAGGCDATIFDIDPRGAPPCGTFYLGASGGAITNSGLTLIKQH